MTSGDKLLAITAVAIMLALAATAFNVPSKEELKTERYKTCISAAGGDSAAVGACSSLLE